MGVDGINGPGGPGIPESPEKVRPAEGEFSVAASSVAASSDAVSAEGASTSVGPSDLDRVASGELSVDEYLDERVRRATSHLSGALSPEQLGDLREALREQLSSDPVLIRLVNRTLGNGASEASAPEPSR